MIDWKQHITDEKAMQSKQASARDTGNVITITVKRIVPGCGPTLHIDTNHPALLRFSDETGELGYFLSGGLVHSLTGSCPCNMTPIEDMAKEGITELRIAGDDGNELVIPIPVLTPPDA